MKKLLLGGLAVLLLAGTGGLVHAASTIPFGKPITLRADAEDADSYTWTFPGNQHRNGRTTHFTFTQAGKQKITLVVKRGSDTNQSTQEVVVQNPSGKPTAVLGVTVDNKPTTTKKISITRGQNIVFRSESLAPKGRKVTLKESWSVNGKGVPRGQLPAAFSAIGDYQVKLIVNDPQNPNLRDEATLTVQVRNLLPKITNIDIVRDKKLGDARIVLIPTAKDPDGKVVRYRFGVLENGKISQSQLSTEPYAEFDLTQLPGKHTYTFQVEVTDNDGAKVVTNINQPLTVTSNAQNTAPQINITASPGNSGTTQTEFLLYAEATDANGDALDYRWTLPSGKILKGETIQHRFSQPGTYPIQVQVSDGIDTTQASMDLLVFADPNAAENGENQPPNINICANPGTTGTVETPFSFYSNATDPNKDALTYRWDMGDGSQYSLPNVSHSFEVPGPYTVTLRVSDGTEEQSESKMLNILPEGSPAPSPLQNLCAKPEEAKGGAFKVQISAPGAMQQPVDLKRILEEAKTQRETLLPLTKKAEEKQILEQEISQIDRELQKLKQEKFHGDNETKGVLQTIRREKVNQYINAPTPEKKKILQQEIQIIDKNLTSINNTNDELERRKVHLQHIVDLTTDPNAKEQLTQELEKLDSITIVGTTRTMFFLYGKAFVTSDNPMAFEWNMGDDTTQRGQNASKRYLKPGIYTIQLKVTDGLTITTDSIKIMVVQP